MKKSEQTLTGGDCELNPDAGLFRLGIGYRF